MVGLMVVPWSKWQEHDRLGEQALPLILRPESKLWTTWCIGRIKQR